MIVDAIRAGDTTRARGLAEEPVRLDMNRLIDLRLSLESPPPDSPPGIEGIDSAVSALESCAVSLLGTAAESIRTVEEAAHDAISRAKRARLDELNNVYYMARQNLNAMPELYGTGFRADSSYFGEPGSIWCYLPSGPESAQRYEYEMGPEFYDYLTTPWWPAPDPDDKVHATYAYIDALGANQHVVTSANVSPERAQWQASLPQTSSSASSRPNSTLSSGRCPQTHASWTRTKS
ncbi:hypothetical protein StoSoilB13_03820 [Arthrobacter sp. StoSoilB13]|nr:hypothetical protein StoSoilB13_03820 [Arthrobacter sp. StoSoilB13]